MFDLNYNIHDLLKIKMRTTNKDLTSNLKYSYFSTTDSTDNQDITLNIGTFKPSYEGAVNIAHKYYVKENYFYCKEKGSHSKWEIEIFGFETGKTVINFNGKKQGLHGIFFPTFLAQEFLIPIIEYKLARIDHFLIHGGAVCKDNRGIILIGRPGVWKTSLILDLIRTNQYQFLGDDRLILKEDGSILCFPTSLFLFDYVMTHMVNENRDLVNNLKLLFNILIGKSNKISINTITKCQNLTRIIFVSRKTTQDVQMRPLLPQEVLNKLICNNMAEYVESTKKSPIGQFYNYIQVYSLIFPNNELLNHLSQMKRGLQNIVMKSTVQEIALPFKYEQTAFNILHTQFIEED